VFEPAKQALLQRAEARAEELIRLFVTVPVLARISQSDIALIERGQERIKRRILNHQD
jgi:hypothetical protein